MAGYEPPPTATMTVVVIGGNHRLGDGGVLFVQKDRKQTSNTLLLIPNSTHVFPSNPALLCLVQSLFRRLSSLSGELSFRRALFRQLQKV